MPPLALDVHQHLWPEPFLEALARRSAPPCLRRHGDDWVLRLDGEPDFVVDRGAHDPAARAEALAADGVDAALLCNSVPLGIEALPDGEAGALLDAWHDGVFGLAEPFGVWGAVATADPQARDVNDLLDRGAVGVSLAAGALATPEGLERLEPLLRALEDSERPLLVHPGPAPAGAPRVAWWPPAVSYVTELHAAWHAFAGWGRPALPRLRVLFVALAGAAPLHVERLAGRGGPADAAFDPLTFYDTSSYGPRAIEAVGGVVGIDQLVHGSDRPVVDAPPAAALGAAGEHALRAANPARLLTGDPVAA
ncbi:MAG: 6-methylsalicylate decarboxylase [Solirubrobacteraceae bacterium]|nr:6-methylsalicylate decarboxylase [Solirubrobacteraceae bacterium]